MHCDRRDFLRTLTLGGTGLLAAPEALASGHPVPSDGAGVLVDLSKCNGCRRCEAACREANDNPRLDPATLDDSAVYAHHRTLGPESFTLLNRYGDDRAGGGDAPVFVKSNCLHCLDPACASACLVGALKRQPDGAVTYDAGKCIGCRYCMVACPFQVPAYEYDSVLTPRVRKCELCTHYRAETGAAVPACVQACPRECLTFGKRAELLTFAHARIAARPQHYIDHVYGEHEAGGTAWLYLSAVPFAQIGFPSPGDTAPPRLSEAIQHGVFAHWIPPVAWLGILSLTMWMTRPGQESTLAHPAAVASNAAPVDGADADEEVA